MSRWRRSDVSTLLAIVVGATSLSDGTSEERHNFGPLKVMMSGKRPSYICLLREIQTILFRKGGANSFIVYPNMKSELEVST